MEKLALTYNAFQNHYGQSLILDYAGIIQDLFSPHFKKIANGLELVAKRADIESQLRGVKEFAGSWRIESKMVIPSLCHTRCTMRYILSSDKGSI